MVTNKHYNRVTNAGYRRLKTILLLSHVTSALSLPVFCSRLKA